MNTDYLIRVRYARKKNQEIKFEMMIDSIMELLGLEA